MVIQWDRKSKRAIQNFNAPVCCALCTWNEINRWSARRNDSRSQIWFGETASSCKVRAVVYHCFGVGYHCHWNNRIFANSPPNIKTFNRHDPTIKIAVNCEQGRARRKYRIVAYQWDWRRAARGLSFAKNHSRKAIVGTESRTAHRTAATDHLTGLFNRRAFEVLHTNTLKNPSSSAGRHRSIFLSTETVCRYGGEEFIVTAENCVNLTVPEC